MRQKFYFRGFERIIQEVVTQIKAISPNLLQLLWFWHHKNSEAGGSDQKNWGEPDETKDSYDRQDNYNVFGLSIYLNFSFKSALCQLTGNL